MLLLVQVHEHELLSPMKYLYRSHEGKVVTKRQSQDSSYTLLWLQHQPMSNQFVPQTSCKHQPVQSIEH